MNTGASSLVNCPWIDSPFVNVFKEAQAYVIRVRTLKPKTWNAKYVKGMAANETISWRDLKHPVARNRIPGNFPPK